MSRIGRKPVALPPGVTVTVNGHKITVKGSKGELVHVLLPEVTVKLEGSVLIVERTEDTDAGRARHGLTRALIANMVKGVDEGFSRQLELIGVGYKAALKGKNLQLQIGFSHPVDFPIPVGVDITQDEKNKNLLTVKGIDKQLVGQVSSDLRALRPPEPYKGKGIRYTDEIVRRKVGKAASAKAA